MQISGLGQTPQTLTLDQGDARTAAWKVGQLLKVTAVSDTVQGRVWLQAGRQQFQAQTGQALHAGQELQVRVAQVKEQRVLQIVSPVVSSDPASLATLRALPRQDSIQPLLANLLQLTGNAEAQQKMPSAIRQLVQEGVALLRLSSSVQSQQGLKQALRDSGIFYEAKLAQLAQHPGAQLGADLKAYLLRLQAALQQWRPAGNAKAAVPNKPDGASPAVTAPAAGAGRGPAAPAPQTDTPPPQRLAAPVPQAAQAATLGARAEAGLIQAELSRQVEAVLARVQLHQLNSLPVADDRTQAWILELPLRGANATQVFHLQIEEQDSQQAVAGEHRWSVMLAFDIAPLGPVRARVSVMGEQASAVFWAEQAHSQEMIQQQLPVLQQALEQAGLEVQNLDCHQGQAPTLHSPAANKHYIDESV